MKFTFDQIFKACLLILRVAYKQENLIKKEYLLELAEKWVGMAIRRLERENFESLDSNIPEVK